MQGIALHMGWETRLNDRKSMAFFVQQGIFSDMKDLSGRDFRYGFGFRHKTRHSPKFSSGFGLGYSRQFFGNQIVPFVYLDYRPNGRVAISGQFPARPKFQYRINAKNALALELAGDASSFRLSDAAGGKIVQLNQWRAAAKWEFELSKHFGLFVTVGANLRNTYKRYEGAGGVRWTVLTVPVGEKTAPAHKISGQGPFLQVGMELR